MPRVLNMTNPGVEPSVVTTSITTREEEPAAKSAAAKTVLTYEDETDEDDDLPPPPPKKVQAVATMSKEIPQTPTKSNRGKAAVGTAPSSPTGSLGSSEAELPVHRCACNHLCFGSFQAVVKGYFEPTAAKLPMFPYKCENCMKKFVSGHKNVKDPDAEIAVTDSKEAKACPNAFLYRDHDCTYALCFKCLGTLNAKTNNVQTRRRARRT